MENKELLVISPLTLAYLGDAIYEAQIRDYLIRTKKNYKINSLHRLAIKYVSATSQSNIIHCLIDELSEEELTIYKRGRNHKKTTASKNANIIDYRASTGFEALIGYLYLKEDEERFKFIINRSIEIVENKIGGDDDGDY